MNSMIKNVILIKLLLLNDIIKQYKILSIYRVNIYYNTRNIHSSSTRLEKNYEHIYRSMFSAILYYTIL